MLEDTATYQPKSFLDTHAAGAGTSGQEQKAFRERAIKVGSVYTISYDTAIVAIYDHDREQAGGLPKSMFLIAAKAEGDGTFILLRVQKEARLPRAAENDLARQQGLEASGNEEAWGNRLDPWMRDQLSLHALECAVLGTFIDEGDGIPYRYAEDIDNYYAVHELMVWKPDPQTLDIIVNYKHRTNGIPIEASVAIGRTRFAAAERETAAKVDFHLNPTDIMKRRTAYFGMSRSGKSNGLKVVAEAVYRLRDSANGSRIGQLIFDLSGEYAQDNPQDGKALHKVHEVLGLDRDGEVATYGLIPVDWDESRKIMKLNFFGDDLPSRWDDEEVAKALEQLIAGRQIIQGVMAHESSRYITSFRDADISSPLDGESGGPVRYKRAILAYRTALYAAGLTPPNWQPSIFGLFSEEIISALSARNNPSTGNSGEYD